AGNSALMAPYVAVAIEELVDIKFKRLRGLHIVHVKVDVISEVVQRGNKRVLTVGQSLRGKVPNQVVVPQHVRVDGLTADGGLGGISAQRGRANALRPRPGSLWSARFTRAANVVGRWLQRVSRPAVLLVK